MADAAARCRHARAGRMRRCLRVARTQRRDGSVQLRRPARDRGSATVWMSLLICTVLFLGAWALALGQAVTARHRAGAAADLAALAAADHALDGEQRACGRAAEVARAQQARVVACALRGEIADVVAEVRPSTPLAVLPPARSRARAGPASALSDEHAP
jgi:secretion/DNA translocation related TadE-like protein